ncbi:capping protein inhibiting regulator of actin dynamics isoform X2 [Paramisgurnus dabryanus]|uniref:capping protein inhibiting regulator of actin dynamics isoform X2 n=1 Tax=Paramisgurnus dabryanus TaxID=90735 RepID=UPI0031F3A93E
MFPKVFLHWCAALSSCASEIEWRRQGKFQPFRRLFGKKKRRKAPRGFEGSELKASHSTDNVCNGVVSVNQENDPYLSEVNTLESRAFSHESVFIPEDSENAYPGQTMSQENVSDKVKNIQKQIGHNIKFGQRPPSHRKSEGDEGSSDEEDVPQNPLRVLAQVETEPPETEAEEKAISHDIGPHRTPVKSPRTKRPPPPGTIESINLDAVPQFVPRLDNTAAKHKLSVKPKNQRVSRKHRRSTQDFHEVDLSEVQEETETQKHEEVFDVSGEDYNIIHGSKEDYEPTEKSIRKRLHEEELERLELQKREEEEERKKKEQLRKIEEQRLEEEKRHKQEQMQKEEEERKEREEKETKAREEEEKRKAEERLRIRQQEERKRQEEEERIRKQEAEKIKKEEEERTRAEEERRQQEIKAQQLRLEEEREREQEERRRKEEVAEKLRIQELEEKQQREEEERLHKEERCRQEKEAEEDKKREEKEIKKHQKEEKAAEAQTKATDPEWKRKAEELRWREMEERQRPFTFKVSSGEKQILFQKVNLTPVTPATGQHSETTAETSEGAKVSSPGYTESPTLSSSLYVPHTAILVTGAQLCGTAVNLDQIKDTACKSLLGLSEAKKATGTPPTKSKTSPDRQSGKTKSLFESSLSADQSSAAVLAEWASIRSKILKGAEEGNYPDQSRKQSQSRPISEDLNTVPFSHTSLRKTMSASAKFSITPARKKFADSNRSSEVFSPEEKESGKIESVSAETPPVQKAEWPSLGTKNQGKGSKVTRIADNAEECMFAKDLPSFLVPSPSRDSSKSQRFETGSPSQSESEESDAKDKGDQKDQGVDERPSPFGIKLRRTNYSLRFHNEQSAEKRKKRYSAGDSFEGVPVPLTSTDQDSDTSTLSERSSPATSQPETSGIQTTSAPSKESRIKFGRNTLPSTRNEVDNFVPKPILYQKPATSPQPSEAATPPPSPFLKPGKRTSGDMVSQTKEEIKQVVTEQSSDHKDDTSASVSSQRHGPGEDELKEKKSFFPSISIPWREKTDRRTELIKREKPSLQARHSLDSTRTHEKETGPLWITLALQKQKGFREQQQSREERKSQREAKLAEKLAKESAGTVSPTEDKGNENSSHPKPQTALEHKRPDTLLTRFERRDNLKKANTLPSSVTVEITDPTPSPPATKDVTKRFPPGDTTQVSTEPAWLALAKRKAKAWSDCPQIIK